MTDKKSLNEDSFVLVKSQRRQKRGPKHSTNLPVANNSIEHDQEAEDRLIKYDLIFSSIFNKLLVSK